MTEGEETAPAARSLSCLAKRVELQVWLDDRHRAIPTARVDNTFVIKLGAGDDHNAAIRNGPVSTRGNSWWSRLN